MSTSSDEYAKREYRNKEMLELFDKSSDLGIHARKLISLAEDEKAQLPVLARAWGNHALADKIETIIPYASEGYTPCDGLPWTKRELQSSNLEMIPLAMVIHRNRRRTLGALKGMRKYIERMSEQDKKRQFERAIFEFLSYEVRTIKTTENYPQFLLSMLGELHRAGARLETPNARKTSAQKIAHLSCQVIHAGGQEGYEDAITNVVSMAKLLEKLGARKEDIAPPLHACLIRGRHERQKINSPIPDTCMRFVRAGFPLIESAGSGSFYYNPTVQAFRLGLVRAIPTLLKNGADILKQDVETGNTILMVCSDGKKSTMKALDLVAVGSFAKIIDLKNNQGDTALHVAVSQMSPEMIERILEEGANTQITNAKGKTPIQLLENHSGARAQKNFDKIVSIFERYGVVFGEEGTSFPLHASARSLSENGVARFISEGHDIRGVDNNGRYPVEMAISYQPKLNSAKEIKASSQKQFNIIQQFLDAGLDINEAISGGKTILRLAMDEKRWPLVKMLMRDGADINQKDDRGSTPFQIFSKKLNPDYFIGKQREELKDLLVMITEAGADITSATRKGNDPLEIFMGDSEFSTIIKSLRETKVLLDNTAEVKTPERKGLRL